MSLGMPLWIRTVRVRLRGSGHGPTTSPTGAGSFILMDIFILLDMGSPPDDPGSPHGGHGLCHQSCAVSVSPNFASNSACLETMASSPIVQVAAFRLAWPWCDHRVRLREPAAQHRCQPRGAGTPHGKTLIHCLAKFERPGCQRVHSRETGTVALSSLPRRRR